MLLIYTHKESPRFKYISKQIFERILGISINITYKLEDFVAYSGPKFSYSKQPLSNELFFQSVDLLFEQGVNENIINIKDWNGLPCFYSVFQAESAIPFDVFAASFYMLTRYEEYLPQVKDKLGRFIATSSIANQNNFLQEPVVDWWAQRIKRILLDRFPELEVKEKKFEITLLCEVNEAYAFQKKGWLRTVEGFLFDISHFNFQKIFLRSKTLLGFAKDPFDNFYYLVDSARKRKNKIQFFFGLGNYSSHEKSTSVNSKTYQKLIKSIADYFPVGLRLSYDSLKNDEKLKLEKKRFEQITHRVAEHTFCQYSKINLPNTYRSLVEHEITNDYSMGFMENAGFRAGTCTPFLFYDLDYEIQTPLKITPFCLTNKAFDKINNIEVAMQQTEKLLNKVKSVNGSAFIRIQNDLFDENSTKSIFWKKIYEYLLSF